MVTPFSVMTTAIAPAESRERCRRLRLVLTDCDGVLTDGQVYVSERGEELKRFSLRDGMGFERLRGAGLAIAIVTRERSAIVSRRAEKLGVRLFQGINDKAEALPSILAECGGTLENTAYIGDDVNDFGAMRALSPGGITAAPADAEPGALLLAHFVCTRPGGAGAFREFAEWILSNKSSDPDGNETSE